LKFDLDLEPTLVKHRLIIANISGKLFVNPTSVQKIKSGLKIQSYSQTDRQTDRQTTELKTICLPISWGRHNKCYKIVSRCTVFYKCKCNVWVCIWLKLTKVCVREYRNCLAVHCAKTKSPNVTDVIQCIRWLVKVQSLYIVWHQHMRAYAYTLAYAGTRWYTLVVR